MTLANDVTALGTLGLTTTNAPILQTGGSIVAVGTATVSAGSGDITLAQPTNNFQGSLLLSGGAVSVRDVDDLAVTSLVSGVNKPVSLIAGGSLSLPPSAIDTGTADLTLQALGGTLVINGPLSGNNVTLTGSAGLALGADITSSGDSDLHHDGAARGQCHAQCRRQQDRPAGRRQRQRQQPGPDQQQRRRPTPSTPAPRSPTRRNSR